VLLKEIFVEISQLVVFASTLINAWAEIAKMDFVEQEHKVNHVLPILIVTQI